MNTPEELPESEFQGESDTPLNRAADDVDVPALDYPVVGIGSSAGGLEALKDLLTALPAGTGMSFVLIPHLPAGQQSILIEILSRHTNTPISWIQHGARPDPNQIYILEPGSQASLADGKFHVEPRLATDRVPHTIDHFLRSLAADQRSNSIAIILSGTDSDGALGIRAVKSEGGIAIVQDPATAKFPGMPRSSILADNIDLVLPPAQIGTELAQIANSFRSSVFSTIAEQGDGLGNDENSFNRILTMIRGASGIDYRLYKRTTIRRRIARRMMLKQYDSLAAYARQLQTSPDELRELQEDILISVTRFFRDPEVFDVLRDVVFPSLFSSRSNRQVRIWVPGCATGEEPYSIAMCLLEHMSANGFDASVQIFATDASERTIEKARIGVYPDSIVSEVGAERLQRFFVKGERGVQVSKRIRDLCIFARQNLCHDPPFSRLDLISCRNVLIYLGSGAQNRVVDTFNYALRPGGFLLLGNTESLRDNTDLFTVVDRKHKIYTRTQGGPSTTTDLFARLPQYSNRTFPVAGEPQSNAWNDLEIRRAADRLTLARLAPPAVVVNENFEVLHIRGHTAPFLQVSPGSPSFNILRLAREGLAPAIRDGILGSSSSGLPVRISHIRSDSGEEKFPIAVDILPMELLQSRQRCFLILFTQESDSQDQAGSPDGSAEVSPAMDVEPVPEVARLRQDLASSRRYLNSLMEERDLRNQELTSAYEELQSANEELQSTNEELETAKEELQSTIEELQTVNDELRNRNSALVQASNDLSNLFSSIHIPVVMLDNDLTIRHYTPPLEKLMHVRPSDVGRPIREIRLNIRLDEIEPLLKEVLDTLVTKEFDVRDKAGYTHLLRIRPYRNAENKIEGLILVFLDVNQIRRSEQTMRESRDFSRGVVESVQLPIVVLDADFKIYTANHAFRTLVRLDPGDLDHRSFPELVNHVWRLKSFESKLASLRTDSLVDSFEFEHRFAEDEIECLLRINVRAVRTIETETFVVILEDITNQRRSESILVRERGQLAGEVRKTSAALMKTQEDLRALAARLFTSQEDERQRVALDLHDDVGQQLASLQIELERVLRESTDQVARDSLDDIRQRIENAAHTVRRISHQLHPSILANLGLSPALRQLVESFGEQERSLSTFTGLDVPDELPLYFASAFYRIAQEALRNVAKHAGPTHVRVSLQRVDSTLSMSIRDLGDGFDAEGQPQTGLGLLSMKERARLIGGELRVESTLGGGTLIKVDAPLPAAAVEEPR